MNTFNDWRKFLKLKVSKQVAKACRKLKSRGLRFCIDFGTQNALDMARMLRSQCRHQKGKKK